MLAATDAVTTEVFWGLIEGAQAGGDGCGSRAAALGSALAKLSPEQMVQFDLEMKARLIESYRWDLWGVAYLVNHGASDDGFEYFRGWLIAQGRAYFEAALREPERAAERAELHETECEEILYVAADTYESATRGPMPESGMRYPEDPAGEPWDEAALLTRYPVVARRFDWAL